MKKYTCSRQRGTKGHCFQAQVFRPDGTSLCAIEPTDDENEASNMAEFICKGLNEKLKKDINALSEIQKEYLLKFFFRNNVTESGWQDIATKLLETGECVVAGNQCIWRGGIGNFIKTETADEFFGCLKYSFNLPIFLKSEYYKGITEEYAQQLSDKRSKLDKELVDIYLLK